MYLRLYDERQGLQFQPHMQHTSMLVMQCLLTNLTNSKVQEAAPNSGQSRTEGFEGQS